MKFLIPLFLLGLITTIATFSLSQPSGSGSTVPAETLPTGCANNEILKSNGSGKLVCAVDASGGGGTPNILDLGDDMSNESEDLIEIATTGDTNSIFTLPAANKLLIDVGLNWPTADTADQLTLNGSNCAAGNFPLGVNALGGVESCTDAATQAELDSHTHIHASTHAENASDEIFAENLGTACSDGQKLGANATGGLDCVAGTPTLDQAFDIGATIDGASSRANALFVGDGNNDGFLFYVGASGPVQECVTDFGGGGEDGCNEELNVISGKSFILSLAGTDELTITSSGTVTLGEALEETKVLSVPAGMIAVDGTNCTKNNPQTINSESYLATVTCGDNDSATMKISFPAPAAWDEAELTLTAYAVNTDAIPDGSLDIDWSGYCASHNDPFGTDNYEPEVSSGSMDIDLSAVAQNDLVIASTTGQVPIGTCAEGDMISLRGQVDAVGTDAATPEDTHFLWIVVKLAFNSWSN